MRLNKLYIMGVVAGLALLVAPVAQAATLTSDQVNAIVTLLQSFGVDQNTISTVETVLNGQQPIVSQPGSSTPQNTPPQGMPPGQQGKAACITLNRNLSVGSQGTDVKDLQEMLSQDPEDGFNAAPTGFFGPMTEKAVQRYQTQNGIASSSTGFVGPLTRGFFERHCGEGLGTGEDNNNGNQGDNHGGNGIMVALVFGTISADNGSSITINDINGQTVTADITASTTISVFATSTPPTTGSVSNLSVGQTVSVNGPHNSDGSINAVTITAGVPLPIAQPENAGGDQGNSDH